MRFYKFPKWQQWFYPNAIFDFYTKNPIGQKTIYLTFDDGPTPGVTNVILDSLDKYNAKASFFCLGEKVKANPLLFQEIIKKGHSVGNHSMTHVNGFNMSSEKYVKNVLEAQIHINSKLFRPPYGKCTPRQHRLLSKLGFKTIFWSHLSYDFDKSLDSKSRLQLLKTNSKNGSIIVFHDTINSFNEIEFNSVMKYYSEERYRLIALE